MVTLNVNLKLGRQLKFEQPYLAMQDMQGQLELRRRWKFKRA
jgi:hypothetical protein